MGGPAGIWLPLQDCYLKWLKDQGCVYLHTSIYFNMKSDSPRHKSESNFLPALELMINLEK